MGHKKKKNKAAKATESVTTNVRELDTVSEDHINANGTEQNHQVPETVDVGNGDVQKTVVDLDSHGTDNNTSILTDAEKLSWLHREASLKQKIKELLGQLDAHIHKEADLETSILQAQSERSTWFQKEADLERKILELHTEKVSWLQKEAGYEGKINELTDEIATLRLMGVNLEERIKQLNHEKVYLAQQENSEKETIVCMKINNTRLQSQVIEMEASRTELLHENLQLKENVSNMHFQIQNLETVHASEKQELISQLEAARELVGKLVSENDKLVEKVNDLNAELDRRSVTAESSSFESEPMVRSAETAGVTESSPHEMDFRDESHDQLAINTESLGFRADIEQIIVERPGDDAIAGPSLSDEIIEAMEEDIIEFKKNYINNHDVDLMPNSRESIGEIVQIPLEENEFKVTESETSDNNENDDVPLTDAPLIGAPFRFISFVARYVSGADLVNKSPSER